MNRRGFFKRLGSGAAGAAAAKVLPEPLYSDDPPEIPGMDVMSTTGFPLRRSGYRAMMSTLAGYPEVTIEDFGKSYDIGPELSKELREAIKDE